MWRGKSAASMPRNALPMISHQNSVQLARFLVPRNSRMEFGAFYSQSYFVASPAHCLLLAHLSPTLPPITLFTLEDSAPALPPQEAPHQGSQQAQALVLIGVHLTLSSASALVSTSRMNLGREMQLVPHCHPRLHLAQRRDGL